MPQDFTFKKGFSAERILDRIKSMRVIAPDGSVTLSMGLSDDWRSIATSALNRPDHASDQAFRSAVRTAIFSPKLGEAFTVKDFEAECRAAFGKFLARPQSDFRLFFELSLLPTRPATWLAANGCRIYFDPSPRSILMQAARTARESAWQKQFPGKTISGPRHGLMPVIVHVKARSSREARQQAVDGLDEIRGLINFVLNERRLSQTSFGPRKPVNFVRMATMQTVHKEDGTMVSGDFWYEREWVDTKAVSLTVGENPTMNRFQSAHSKLSRPTNGLAEYARVALRQYARALDDENWTNAFLDLWVVLEYLTGISHADYDRLVSRASFMYEQHADMRELAQHLRVRRNEIVHSSAQDADAEELIFQAKRLIEPLLQFYIINPFNLKSIEEVRQFLDLPKEPEQLRSRQQMIHKGLHFRQLPKTQKPRPS